MDSNNPRWDPSFSTGIYYHKKYQKIALSEPSVGCSSENSLVSGSEEQKRLIKVYQTDMDSGDNKMIAVHEINPEIAETRHYGRLEVCLSINKYEF